MVVIAVPPSGDTYIKPRNLAEAMEFLSRRTALVMCGGTDVFPALVGRPEPRHVLDLYHLKELRGIDGGSDLIRIGAATSWSEIQNAGLPAAFDALKEAAREVGSIQIQNRGSIGGNLCNASPAADSVPPLLALESNVELASVRGTRILPLASFITGYRKTALAPDEILTAVLVPQPRAGARSAFVKLGTRRYLVISILMAAALVTRDGDGRIEDVAVAIGAASPVAQRLTLLEQSLRGLAPNVAPSSRVTAEHLASLTPIDDVRATAAYRSEAAITLVGEALDRAAGVRSRD